MIEYCCEKFRKTIEDPGSAYDRKTTFQILDGEWWTDFSDGEYGDIQIDWCPFCGKKLEVS